MFFTFVILILMATSTAENKAFAERYVKRGEFPFIAILGGKVFCAVIIVRANKVLSTGECVMNDGVPITARKHFIVAGVLTFPTIKRGAQKRGILFYKVHELYAKKNDGSKKFDIALIEVDQPFVLGETVALAAFPSLDGEEFRRKYDQLASEGKTCTAAGWGFVPMSEDSFSDKKRGNLKAFELALVKRSKCAEQNWKNDTDNSDQEICVSGTQVICDGYLGSPLICDGAVFGLAKSVKECSDPQFFVLIGPFLDYFDLGNSPHLDFNAWLTLLIFIDLKI